MTADDRGGFLHRWSRRKVDAREGRTAQDEGPLEDTTAKDNGESDVRVQPLADAAPAPADSALEGVEQTPALTLQDVQALTRDSDFSPFMARQVAPEIKNAALKKLFADPHYNVMDGLDIYIDDYSNLAPLPAPMLRRMVSAQALNMFEAVVGDTGTPATDAGHERATQAEPAAAVDSHDAGAGHATEDGPVKERVADGAPAEPDATERVPIERGPIEADVTSNEGHARDANETDAAERDPTERGPIEGDSAGHGPSASAASATTTSDSLASTGVTLKRATPAR